MLSLDVSRPFHHLSDQQALLEAIVAGNPRDEDENKWLEVKGPLELTKSAGAFEVARHVLGFANRHPDHSTRFAGGYAYLFVGIPGDEILPRMEHLDPAKVVDALRKYLGDSGPVWHHQWLRTRETEVLLVEVEPPAWGDPIHLLHRTFKSSHRGTVFVRNSGGTEPATVGDMEMLQERLLSKVAVGAGLCELEKAEFRRAYNEAGGYGAVGAPNRAAHAWGAGNIQNLHGGRFGKSAILAGTGKAACGAVRRGVADL